MSAAVARPEFLIALAKEPLRCGAPGWASLTAGRRAQDALHQALHAAFAMPADAPAAPVIDAAALAAALAGAIPSGRWSLKTANHHGAIVGKF